MTFPGDVRDDVIVIIVVTMAAGTIAEGKLLLKWLQPDGRISPSARRLSCQSYFSGVSIPGDINKHIYLKSEIKIYIIIMIYSSLHGNYA